MELDVQHHDADRIVLEPEPRSTRGELLEEQWHLRSSVVRCLLAGVGCWAITLAPLVTATKSTALGRAVALVAVVPVVAGPALIHRNNRLARHLGLSLYVVMAALAWISASFAGVLSSFDVYRSALGMLAWGVFALSWSHPWSVSDAELYKAPEGDTMGLQPRRRPPTYAGAIAGMGALAAASCLALTWTIDDPMRAVFGQALACASAVALLTAASSVAVLAGRARSRELSEPRVPLNRKVVNTLVWMVFVASAAVAIYLTTAR